MGFIIPGIIFIGTAIIRLSALGITDSIVLAEIWNTYVIWTFISVAIIMIPLIVGYIRYRKSFREIFLFESGGVFFFSPLWFFFATEITGESFIDTLINGVDNAIAFPGPNGALIGTNIGPVFLAPILIAGMIFGLILLRPSFISKEPATSAPTKAATPKPIPTHEDEDEMPDVAPPVADSGSIDELRKLLSGLSVPPTLIEALINAGYATITDLISTSPEKLAKEAGIGLKMAQDIHLSVQKKIWFGGIE